MGDEMWFPPGEAAMGRGEEEPAVPDATMLMGDEVLQEEEVKNDEGNVTAAWMQKLETEHYSTLCEIIIYILQTAPARHGNFSVWNKWLIFKPIFF